ncbi:MAG: hypothetical protein E6R03_09765 [Hyphomicrobiaceae bacterium]|nr:MAG: hypothetical protein E6R03_09765 [Hyphomicrobiaceae bacterium]
MQSRLLSKMPTWMLRFLGLESRSTVKSTVAIRRGSREMFDRAIEFVLLYEGGYVDDPADAGGETKYGISKKQYPNVDIKNLTLTQAKEIYYRDYWLKFHCDKMPWPLAMVMFDCYVQFNPINPNRWLQSALLLTPDGILGPRTIEGARTARKPLHAARSILLARTDYRFTRPNFGRFGRGWTRRDISLMFEAGRGWDGE